MLWILFSRKQALVQLFAHLIKSLLIERRVGPISDHNLTVLRELAIEGEDDIGIYGPFILFDHLQLAVLPFNKTRIVLALGILVLIYLYQMFHLVHEALSIVTLRDVHGESKHLHVLFGLNDDVLIHSLESLYLHCHFMVSLLF